MIASFLSIGKVPAPVLFGGNKNSTIISCLFFPSRSPRLISGWPQAHHALAIVDAQTIVYLRGINVDLSGSY
jgi:hypothetical protein